MFGKKTIFLLAALLVVISTQNLAFDLRSVKYSQATDFWTVQIPCLGGSGQYSYQYDLPNGWKSEGNRIKIPSASTKQSTNQYVVRCKVKDNNKGDVLQRSLVFKPFSQGSSSSMEVTDHDYFFGRSDLSAYSTSGSSIHGIDVLNRLVGLTQGAGSLGFSVDGGYSQGGAASYSSSSSTSGSGYSGYSNAGSISGYGAGYGSGSGSSYGSGQVSSSGYGSGSSSGYGSGSGSAYSSGYGSGSASGSGSYSSQSSKSSKSSQSYGSQSVYNSQSGYSSQSNTGTGSGYVSASSYYTSFPSISQLEKYISGGSIVEILQTIQLVVDSKIKCEAKSAYLSDFYGRICAAVQIKKLTLKQLKEIVSVAVAQVDKLTIQITTIKSQQASLHLNELNSQVDTLVKQLKVAYDEYNNFSANYSSYETQITTLEKQINEINSRYSEVQQKIQTLRNFVQGIDAQIAEYEQKIRNLKERRAAASKDLSESETFIKEKDTRIKQIRERISVLRVKISNVSSQKDKLKQAYLDLQKQITTVKQSLQINERKFSEYQEQISSITVQIQRYQRQTSQIQVKQVTQCVENLESAMAEIKQSIDFVAYKCFDASDVQIDYDNQRRSGSYHFGKNQWFGYVNKCYSDLGQQIRNKIANSFKNTVIEISTVNVFSDLWKQNYGSCFEKDISNRAQNYKEDKSYGFDSDFSCSSQFGSVQTKSGTIQNIASSYVNVRGDDGKDYTLKLGSCSKFEGQGRDFVPKKGNNVFWKGSRKDNTFNLHSCTCY